MQELMKQDKNLDCRTNTKTARLMQLTRCRLQRRDCCSQCSWWRKIILINSKTAAKMNGLLRMHYAVSGTV